MAEPLAEQDIYGPQHDDDSPSFDWVEGYRAGQAAPEGLTEEALARAIGRTRHRITAVKINDGPWIESPDLDYEEAAAILAALREDSNDQ